MSDNDEMREVWDAHDKARNKAWREEPGTFDTLDAFKAGAAWQAAYTAALPPGFVAVPMTKDRIKEEWDAFIAYPEGSGKLYVTTTSALLFAYLISSMTADAMLAAAPKKEPRHERHDAGSV